jgi:hypothetical protein
LEHAEPKTSEGVVTPSEAAWDDGAAGAAGAPGTAAGALGSVLGASLLEHAAIETAASAAARSEATRWVFFTEIVLLDQPLITLDKGFFGGLPTRVHVVLVSI